MEAFTEIQDEAIRQIGRARSKLDETARLCSAYGLGTGCNLRTLFEKCHKAGLGAASVDSEASSWSWQERLSQRRSAT